MKIKEIPFFLPLLLINELFDFGPGHSVSRLFAKSHGPLYKYAAVRVCVCRHKVLSYIEYRAVFGVF